MVYYNIVSVLFLLSFWCPCMVINVSIQYSGGFLPDIIILLTQCYLHILKSHLNVFMLRRSRRVLIRTTYDIILLFLWYCTVLYYTLQNYWAGADLSLNMYNNSYCTIFQDHFYIYTHLVPSSSETWFRGMSVGGSFRRE